MFMAVLRILAVAFVCWAGGGCHRSAAAASSGVAPVASADTLRDVVLAGTVLDSTNDHPIPGMVVIATVEGMKPGQGHVAAGITDETGRYALRVPYGRYDLYYRRIGFSAVQRLGVLASRAKPESIIIRIPELHLNLDQSVAPGTVETKPQGP